MFGYRPDGKLAEGVPALRRIMPYMMPGRNESVVYFDLEIDVTKTEAFIARYNEAHPDTRITPLHVALWALTKTLDARPRMNRFVAGGKLWQRDGIWISYSAKKRLEDDAPLIALKRRFHPEETFDQMVGGFYGGLREGRSEKKSHVDKELGLVLALPGFVVGWLLGLARWLDGLGLLPRAFIEPDPMYASAFVANLASLKMGAGYHHLYEYGTIGIFCVIGKTTLEPVVTGGQTEVRPISTVRFSFDERVEDGLYAQRSMQLFQRLVEDPLAGGIEAPALPVAATG